MRDYEQGAKDQDAISRADEREKMIMLAQAFIQTCMPAIREYMEKESNN